MNIFDKRPLFSVITSSIIAFVIFTYSDKLLQGILVSSAVFLLDLSLILYFRWHITKKVILVAEIFALLTMILSLLYFDVYFDFSKNYDDEEEVEICGTVQDVTDYGTASAYTLKVYKINGKRIIPRKIKIYVYGYINRQIEIGNKISLNAILCEFEDYADFDSKTYYYGKGISADTKNVHDINVLDEGTIPLTAVFANIRQGLTERAIAESDESAASLLSALLLGERDLLSDELKLSFKRLGITHILALSGLHLSILSLGIQKLLSLFSVKKKPRLAITAVIILLYMALTGFSVSVVRAGIMIIIYSALFLLGQTKDSLTSLSIAVAVILLISPYSVYDVSLWLSALSTLGIVATSGVVSTASHAGFGKKAFSFIIRGLFVSFAATSATLSITAYTFGATSLLAAPATMIFSLLAEAIIYIGTTMLIFGNIFFIGDVLILISDFTYYLAKIISNVDGIYIKIDYPLIKILIIIYTVLFLVFLSINFKNKIKSTIAIVSAFAVIFTSAAVINISNSQSTLFIYSSESGADVLVFHSKDGTSVISHGKYTKSAAYDNVSMLEENGIYSIDNYYLTTYSSKMCDNISKTMSLIKVRAVYIPMPNNDDENQIADEIEYFIQRTETKLIFYDQSQPNEIGELEISNVYSGSDKRCILSINSPHGKLVYASSGALEGETKIIALKQMTDANAIIFGCYGKKYSDAAYLRYSFSQADFIVMQSENLKIESKFLDGYIDSGIEIYTERFVILSD